MDQASTTSTRPATGRDQGRRSTAPAGPAEWDAVRRSGPVAGGWAHTGTGPTTLGRLGAASPLAWLLAVAVAGGLVGGWLGAELGARSRSQAAPPPVVTEVVASDRSALDRVQAVANAVLPVVVQVEAGAGAARATGSGVIMTSDGYVVTNAHVVADASRVMVTLPSAEALRARLVGRDPGSDLAVLKVQRGGLPVANFGSSARLRVGELAVAVGSPFGLRGSVTTGIISALHRVVNLPGSGGGEAGDLVNAIQTDAAVNPGNSGGALANQHGQVVGINTAIASNGQTEANAGIGFAIPIDEALEVARQLIAGQPVRVPFLGVQAVADLSPEVAEQYQLGGRAGALVQSVLAGSPAATAGLRGGDLVVRVAGRAVRGWDELKVAVRQVRVGQTIPIVVVRQGRELTLTITPIDQATAG
ncbi:MAG TPA: trypsin-like peptidase domain-containing protein [Actinomycetota bacterium]